MAAKNTPRRKNRRLVVKIGTAALFDDQGSLDQSIMRHLADDILKYRRQGRQFVIVSSGAIASGIKALGLKERPRTMPGKQAVAAVGQNLLMHNYQLVFGRDRMTVGQILLIRDDFTDRRRYLNARHTLETLLDMGVIPIINENDTVAVEEIKVGDNDTLGALVARAVRADQLIILSDIDGIYDRPQEKEKRSGRILRHVPRIDRSIVDLGRASGRLSSRGVGGISTKIAAARIAAKSGITTVVANGKRPGILGRILAGRYIGTTFYPGSPKRRIK